MPATVNEALNFLETQWSDLNNNKTNGILSEIRFQNLLLEKGIHFIPGGWILSPGKKITDENPYLKKIFLIPMQKSFNWNCVENENVITPAQMSTYNFFRQLGITSYFVFIDNQDQDNEFELPRKTQGRIKANYPTSYNLTFKSMNPQGNLIDHDFEDVMEFFPPRTSNRGRRCYSQGRLDQRGFPWNDNSLVNNLFCFEYVRYFCVCHYLVMCNDLDLFIIGTSGAVYPVEMKSKSSVKDDTLGDWFGLDVGPFTKMAFFTANSMNTDALYVVEEVDSNRNHISWLAIKYTDLVKECSWVGQSGGQGMTGGNSSIVKVPKSAFQFLDDLLQIL